MNMTAGESVQRPQHFDGLRRQRHRMLLALFHPLRRNPPDRRVEVNSSHPAFSTTDCHRVESNQQWLKNKARRLTQKLIAGES